MIRLRLQKRLFVDDAFLFLAVMCLCASVGLIWRVHDDIFAQVFLYENVDPEIPPVYSHDSMPYHSGGVYIILNYITIYFVKLSFLIFFRNLVRRDHRMTIHRRTVLAIVIVTLIASVIITVVPLCQIFSLPHSTVSLFELCVGIRS